VKAIYNYKYAMKRMVDANVTINAAQVAPGGLVGRAGLIVPCFIFLLTCMEPQGASHGEHQPTFSAISSGQTLKSVRINAVSKSTTLRLFQGQNG
jgi:hypothetical protein